MTIANFKKKVVDFFTIERAAIVILLLLLIFGAGMFKRTYDSQRIKDGIIDSLTLANQTSVSFINKQNEVITQQKVLITESQSSIKKYTDSIFNLKKSEQRKVKEVIAFYSEKLKAALADTVDIPYIDDGITLVPTGDADTVNATGEYFDESDCEEYIRNAIVGKISVPKSVLLDSVGVFKIDATILEKGLRINKLEIPDTLSLRVIENKTGLFKPRTLDVQAKHSNPMFTKIDQTSILYKPKPKGKWVVRALILGLGIYLGSKL